MEQFGLRLSARGLANIPNRKESKELEFIVGDSHYWCPMFVADFLSQKIGRQH
jgi:hypothetical protein